MCVPDKIKTPKGWQVVCLKKTRNKDIIDCTLFCSPNGKVARSIEDVQKINAAEEKAKIEKEMASEISPPTPPREKTDEEMDCDQCTRGSFLTSEDKLKHMNIHSYNSAGVTITCRKCNETFNNNDLIQEHMKTVHPPPGPLIKPQSALDSRLKNYQHKIVDHDNFSSVFGSTKTEVNKRRGSRAEGMLSSIPGLNVTKRINQPVTNNTRIPVAYTTIQSPCC